MKTGIIAIVIASWFSPAVLIANQKDVEEVQVKVTFVRQQMQRSTASFLLISKQMLGTGSAGSSQSTEQTVQIIVPQASVRETDLTSAPVMTVVFEADEFKLADDRNDWLLIELEDGREGWVQRDQVQLLEKATDPVTPSVIDPSLRRVAEQMFSDIQESYDEALQLFAEFEEIYADLTSTEQSEISNLFRVYQDDKDKIQTYKAYATHYHEKLALVPSASIAAAPGGKDQIGYQGIASLRLGSSSYKAATKESTTSRNLNLNGAVIFTPRSRLQVNLNHNNDVVQTPYTSNDVNLKFQHQTAGGTKLQGSVLYNSYNDDIFERNNFQNVGVGANVEHPLSSKTRILGDIEANSKNYDVNDGNGYDGAAFNTGLFYNGGKRFVNIGVRGRVQNSDVSFLDYIRVIPNAAVRWLTGNGSFGIRAEAEQLTYDTEAEGNDFNRGRVDLQWVGNTNSTSVIVIAKQYPNNEAFDNYRLRLQNEWNKPKDFGSARTGLSFQYVYHPQEDTQLTNYVDLRFDRNSSSRKAYFDLNLFGRYWEDTDRYHKVDLFSRFGLKFNQIQIGPAIGAQVLLNQDDLQIEQNGNSFRVGIDARANTAIQTAIVYGTLRYQKSLVYNSEISINTSTGMVTQGEITSRMPTTIQFSAGVQVPIMQALDLKIDASYYNIDLDISDEISINPIQTRTGLRVLGGISYRFQR